MRLLAALLFSLLAVVQAQTRNEADTTRLLSQMVQVTRDWDGQSSPGITVSLKERERSTQNGALRVTYTLIAKGAPQDKAFTLVQWPVNSREPVPTFSGVTFAADGTAMCDGRSEEHCGDPKKKDDPIDFTFQPAKGEISRIALISEDRETKVMISVVPDPIMKKDGQCSLEVVRLLPHFELVMVRAHGLQASEKFRMHSNSYDEQKNSDVTADTKGDYVSAILPFVKGKTGGETTVRLQAAHCSPEVKFEWGTK